MIDHLDAVSHVLRSDLDLAPFVTARSVLEAAGQLTWLLEPTDLRERVTRNYAIRVRGLRDTASQAATMAALEPDDEGVRRLAATTKARVKETIDRAHQLGISTHKQAGPDGVRERHLNLAPPARVELVHSAIKHVNEEIRLDLASLLYERLSGVTHSTYDGLRPLVRRVGTTPGRSELAEFGTQTSHRLGAAAYAAAGALAAAGSMATYFGFEGAELHAFTHQHEPEFVAMMTG